MNVNWPRLLLACLAGLGAVLVAYGAVYTHGNPHPLTGDPPLAFKLLPLELLIGLLSGLLVWRAFGRVASAPPRPDAAERMVLRLAMRCGGAFALDDLLRESPLSEPQARGALERLLDAGRLREGANGYNLI